MVSALFCRWRPNVFSLFATSVPVRGRGSLFFHSLKSILEKGKFVSWWFFSTQRQVVKVRNGSRDYIAGGGQPRNWASEANFRLVALYRMSSAVEINYLSLTLSFSLMNIDFSNLLSGVYPGKLLECFARINEWKVVEPRTSFPTSFSGWFVVWLNCNMSCKMSL